MTGSRSSPEADRTVRRADDRHGCVRLPDGAVVVYDRDSHTRWVQSDLAVPLSEVR